jgi:hypothetical protein
MLALAVLLFAGCGRGSFQGRVVEPPTEKPVAGLDLVATPQKATDGCPALVATTVADGAFTLEPTCRGVRYTLTSSDAAWTLVSAPEIVGGVIPSEESRIHAQAVAPPAP